MRQLFGGDMGGELEMALVGEVKGHLKAAAEEAAAIPFLTQLEGVIDRASWLNSHYELTLDEVLQAQEGLQDAVEPLGGSATLGQIFGVVQGADRARHSYHELVKHAINQRAARFAALEELRLPAGLALQVGTTVLDLLARTLDGTANEHALAALGHATELAGYGDSGALRIIVMQGALAVLAASISGPVTYERESCDVIAGHLGVMTEQLKLTIPHKAGLVEQIEFYAAGI